jgi:toxin ParE1/3/4
LITIEFRDAAVASILDQAEYYASVANERLAQRWQFAVDATTLRLKRFPAIGSPCFFKHPNLSGMRRIAVDGFPRYLLFYRFDESADLVDVLDVVHGARDIEAILTPPSFEE